MRRSRLALAIILAVVGLVWIGQGTDIIKAASAMTGNSFWAVVGAVLVVVAAALVVNEARRPATRS